MPNFITNMSKFEKIFWATILLLFSITATLYLAQNPSPPTSPPKEKSAIIVIPKYVTNKNLQVELDAINNTITQAANDLINTSTVDKFLDFHYSVAGEYIELGMGAVGRIEETVTKELFGDDFELKKKKYTDVINEQFKTSANRHAKFISNIAQKDIDKELNEAALQRLENDIEYRQDTQIKKAGVAVTPLVSIIVAKTSIKIAKSAAIKLTVKTASKIAAKGGLAAAVSAAGIFCGPFVWFCAPALGLTVWLGTDYIIIKLDEYWHREEFKQEIIALINSSKDLFIKQYSEVYTKSLRDLSKQIRKIHINSDLKVIERF